MIFKNILFQTFCSNLTTFQNLGKCQENTQISIKKTSKLSLNYHVDKIHKFKKEIYTMCFRKFYITKYDIVEASNSMHNLDKINNKAGGADPLSLSSQNSYKY